jgi:hypothetical protein
MRGKPAMQQTQHAKSQSRATIRSLLANIGLKSKSTTLRLRMTMWCKSSVRTLTIVIKSRAGQSFWAHQPLE